MFRPILVRRFSYWNMFLFRVPKPYKKATSSPTLYFPFWNITKLIQYIWIHDTHQIYQTLPTIAPTNNPMGNNPGLGGGVPAMKTHGAHGMTHRGSDAPPRKWSRSASGRPTQPRRSTWVLQERQECKTWSAFWWWCWWWWWWWWCFFLG